ncbi:MAG: hypothetical protein Q8Q08_01395 [Candidatus Omnitrophota bacterium]|nr:hypothetical protein [Candidatus Omnitrophota bacterium]MDZ4243393.1 hypothetical protein [Candidatus Omnitrophota bacterium]
MPSKRIRNIVISVFTALWVVLFQYESLRHFYLQPLLQRSLPKFKFLFPPAGWIMFFNVDDTGSYAEIYGVRGRVPQLIDPHLIIETRTIGYDNIHRNILSQILNEGYKGDFCRFLRRKFPEYDDFWITLVHYPSFSQRPRERWQQAVYQCRE